MASYKEWYRTVYLQSQHWYATREAAKRRANYSCEICGRKDNLQVHHKHYHSLWRETPEDLRCLCNECHKQQHTHKGNTWEGIQEILRDWFPFGRERGTSS